MEFDAVYVAEIIGSYKLDLRNFQYLITHVQDELSVQMEQILIMANEFKSDHVPAMKVGLTSAVSTLLNLSNYIVLFHTLVRVVRLFEKQRLMSCSSDMPPDSRIHIWKKNAGSDMV